MIDAKLGEELKVQPDIDNLRKLNGKNVKMIILEDTVTKMSYLFAHDEVANHIYLITEIESPKPKKRSIDQADGYGEMFRGY